MTVIKGERPRDFGRMLLLWSLVPQSGDLAPVLTLLLICSATWNKSPPSPPPPTPAQT